MANIATTIHVLPTNSVDALICSSLSFSHRTPHPHDAKYSTTGSYHASTILARTGVKQFRPVDVFRKATNFMPCLVVVWIAAGCQHHAKRDVFGER
jgi:hypothetical protein